MDDGAGRHRATQSTQELIHQLATNLSASVSMQSQTDTALKKLAIDMATMASSISSMSAVINPLGPMAGAGGMYAGLMGMPPPASAAPKASDNQVNRPNHGYSLQSNFMGNLRGGVMQGMYQAVHNAWGTGSGGTTARHQGISKVAGAASLGGGMKGLRMVPYVGEALAVGEGIYKGAEFIGNQRYANSQYQSILGGSNMSGMDQRMQQEGYKLSQLFTGGLTGAQANQAFHQTTALGLQGHTRQQALNFIQGNYKSTGMGVDASMQFVTAATTGVGTSMQALQVDLKQLAKVAKETHMNFSLLAQNLATSITSAQQTGYGAASTAVGDAVTKITGKGPSSLGLGLSAWVNNPTTIAIAAGATGGGTSAQWLASVALNPANAAPGLDAAFEQAMRGVSSKTWAYVDKKIKGYTGGAAALAGQMSDMIVIGRGAAAKSEGNDASFGVAAGILLGQNATGDPGQIYGLMVQWYLTKKYNVGDGTFAKQIAGSQQSQQNSTLTPAQRNKLIGDTRTGGKGRGARSTKSATTPSGVAGWELTNNTSSPILEAAEKQVGKNGYVQISDASGTHTSKWNDAMLRNGNYVAGIMDGSAMYSTTGKKGSFKTLAGVGIGGANDSTTSDTGSQVTGTLNITGGKDLLKALQLTGKTVSLQATTKSGTVPAASPPISTGPP